MQRLAGVLLHTAAMRRRHAPLPEVHLSGEDLGGVLVQAGRECADDLLMTTIDQPLRAPGDPGTEIPRGRTSLEWEIAVLGMAASELLAPTRD